jgi:hypothetical protein
MPFFLCGSLLDFLLECLSMSSIPSNFPIFSIFFYPSEPATFNMLLNVSDETVLFLRRLLQKKSYGWHICCEESLVNFQLN